MLQALKGIRVLDLCRGYPPAFASMSMADFGADVIRIDPTGYSPPLFDKAPEEALSAYTYWDRHKRSIKLALRSPQGRDILQSLAQRCDVLVENSRPGTMERLGAGYSDLKQVNSRIIYCSVSAYGQNGPYRDLVGHDANFLAITGMLSLLGPKGGAPCMPSNIVADVAGAGLQPLIAILIALLARDRTGEGQFIDMSYADSVFSMMIFEVAAYFLSGQLRRRGETYQTGLEPCASVYQTKDGEYVSIQFLEPQFWSNFCHHVGRPDLTSRQWPRSEEERQELYSILKELFLTKTREEWWNWARDRMVMLAPVRYLEEALRDNHLIARGMVQEREHPTLGRVTGVGSPFKLSGTPPQTIGFSPTAGQHTEEILREFGYDENTITELKRSGVVE